MNRKTTQDFKEVLNVLKLSSRLDIATGQKGLENILKEVEVNDKLTFNIINDNIYKLWVTEDDSITRCKGFVYINPFYDDREYNKTYHENGGLVSSYEYHLLIEI